MTSERGALFRGSDRSYGHSIWPVIRRALARRMIKKNIRQLVCWKQTTRMTDLSRTASNILVSGLGKEIRTPPATSRPSRPLDHGSTWWFRGHHLHSLPLPDTKQGYRGLILSWDRRSVIARAECLSACWQVHTSDNATLNVPHLSQTVQRDLFPTLRHYVAWFLHIVVRATFVVLLIVRYDIDGRLWNVMLVVLATTVDSWMITA